MKFVFFFFNFFLLVSVDFMMCTKNKLGIRTRVFDLCTTSCTRGYDLFTFLTINNLQFFFFFLKTFRTNNHNNVIYQNINLLVWISRDTYGIIFLGSAAIERVAKSHTESIYKYIESHFFFFWYSRKKSSDILYYFAQIFPSLIRTQCKKFYCD